MGLGPVGADHFAAIDEDCGGIARTEISSKYEAGILDFGSEETGFDFPNELFLLWSGEVLVDLDALERLEP